MLYYNRIKDICQAEDKNFSENIIFLSNMSYPQDIPLMHFIGIVSADEHKVFRSVKPMESFRLLKLLPDIIVLGSEQNKNHPYWMFFILSNFIF